MIPDMDTQESGYGFGGPAKRFKQLRRKADRHGLTLRRVHSMHEGWHLALENEQFDTLNEVEERLSDG